MIYINPQWQGSGFTDELRAGAEAIGDYFSGVETITVPLSVEDLDIIDNIKAFKPILEQTQSFRKIIEQSNPTSVSTVGGDCGVEVIPISYLNKIYDSNMAVIWIDAHADLNTPESSPSKTFHGMPLRTLLGEGNAKLKDLLFSFIKPEQVCFVGLRDLDKPEADYIVTQKITSLSSAAFDHVQKAIGSYTNVYIHLDLDVLDKSEYPFTLFPTSNGFSISEVANLIEELKENYNVVGFCITESTAKTSSELNSIKSLLNLLKI